MICGRCGTIQRGNGALPGSGWIEFVLWLAAIVPGLIYSIWRRSNKIPACEACGGRDVVALSTPVGRQLREKYHPGPPPRTLRATPLPVAEPTRSLPHRLLRGLGVVLVCIFATGVLLALTT